MKNYKFYRGLAILCIVLFVFASVVFTIGAIKYLYLNPYQSSTDTLRIILGATVLFQIYLAYMIFGCYKNWKRCIRYRAYTRRYLRENKKNAELSAFVNTHLY